MAKKLSQTSKHQESAKGEALSPGGKEFHASASQDTTSDSKDGDKKLQADKLKAEGNDHFRSGKYIDAIVCYNKAIKRGSSPSVCYANMAMAYLKLEQYAAAEITATLALEFEPKNVKARYRRAIARKAMLMFKSAVTDLETILRCAPCEEARLELDVVHDLWESADGYFMATDRDTSDDDLPHFHDEARIPSSDDECDSDPEDFTGVPGYWIDYTHIGNGIPCRFYNHNGCARGDQCTYSHAPDSKSVRDSLGKNVCLFYLFGGCKFGKENCVYSHSKMHLSKNWSDKALREPIRILRTFRGKLLLEDIVCMFDDAQSTEYILGTDPASDSTPQAERMAERAGAPMGSDSTVANKAKVPQPKAKKIGG